MAADATSSDTALKRTPLYDLHVSQGARMVPFAGWEMPVQYPSGVLAEHQHTRSKAGLFDVSHMGQVLLYPPRGQRREDASPDAPEHVALRKALEALVPADLIGLKRNRLRYGLFTSPQGGILDDLMITNKGDHLYLVTNAACAEQDLAHMQAGLEGVAVEAVADRAMLALQGPQAARVLEACLPGVSVLQFMDAGEFDWQGSTLWVSRSGYTGEDGFEVSLPADAAMAFAQLLLGDADVALVGLGARDSLRLEVGMLLYGSDMGPDTTPGMVGLGWAIPGVRRYGGAREGGFPGAGPILDELAAGPDTTRMGLRPEGRAPVRDGVPLFAQETGGETIGTVSSGGFSPTLGAPVATATLPVAIGEGTRIWGELRGRRVPLVVTALPFVQSFNKR